MTFWVGAAFVLLALVVPSRPTFAQPGGGAITARVDTDTTPARPAEATAYTGMRLGYRQSGRYTGTRVTDTSDPEVLVLSVESGSPAERAGLEGNDVLLELDGVGLQSNTVLNRLTPGTSYTLRVRRGQDELELTMVPGPPRPATSRRAAP